METHSSQQNDLEQYWGKNERILENSKHAYGCHFTRDQEKPYLAAITRLSQLNLRLKFNPVSDQKWENSCVVALRQQGFIL